MDLDLEDQYDKIYRYCYFKVNNPQIAEDLTQETFLKFYNKKDSYIDRGKPLAYLYTIARNLCIDSYRKGKKNEELNEEIEGHDEIDAFENRFIIKQAIANLSDEIQEIVLLRYANQLKIGEIAELIGISRFAVNRKLKRALKELKSILKEDL